MAEDKSIATFQAQIKKEIKGGLDEVNAYLMKAVQGKLKEDRVTAKGTVVKVGISHTVRVAAAKVWKEINLDKIVPDMKEQKTTTTPESDKIVKAVKTISDRKRKEAEEKAKKDGKLASMDGKR